MAGPSFISKVLRQRGYAGKGPDSWLFVGLGNPGREYVGTRHNIGFVAVDALREDMHVPPFKSKYDGEWTECPHGGVRICMLKPLTYMNESGRSVGPAAKFYKIPPDRIVVFHDELDLKPGDVRVKQGGGNAGHNGLKSIEAHLGTGNFWRVRIGIGHPGDRALVSNYVLGNFMAAEREIMDKVIASLVDNAGLLLKGDFKEYEQKTGI
jgi:PTH1 family peptidyl-tRNA hydrolase